MNLLGNMRGLLRNRTGVAMVEFAMRALFLLVARPWGTEVADNASRIGDTSTLQNRKIYESDITM